MARRGSKRSISPKIPNSGFTCLFPPCTLPHQSFNARTPKTAIINSHPTMTSTSDDPCLTPPPPAPPRRKRSSDTSSTGTTAAAAGDSETTAETAQPDCDHENSRADNMTHEQYTHDGAEEERPSSPPHTSTSPMAPSPSVFARIGASLLLSQDNLAGMAGPSPTISAEGDSPTRDSSNSTRNNKSKYETAPELPFVAGSAENTPRTENLYYPPMSTSPLIAAGAGADDAAGAITLSTTSGVHRKQCGLSSNGRKKKLERPPYRPRNKIPEGEELVTSEESRAGLAAPDENLIVPPSPSKVSAPQEEATSSAILSSPPLPSRHHVPSRNQSHQRQQHQQQGRRQSHSRRILDRDGGFAQSRGRWSVGNASWLSDRSLLRQQLTAPTASGLTRSGGGNNDSNDSQGSHADDGNSDDWVEVSSNVSYDEDGRGQHQCCLSRLFCCLRQTRGGRSSAISRLHASPFRRCWDNWYHSLAYTPTAYLMMILFLCYAGTIVLFALIYLGVSRLGSDQVDHSSFCGLDIHTLTEAL